jgi:chemotaxis protein MotA
MEKKFEISTFIGIFLVFVLILIAIALGGTSILNYIDFPSFLIVVGGTFCVTCASFTISDVIKTLSASTQTMFYTPANKKQIAFNCVRISEFSKKNGLLALSKKKEVYSAMPKFFKKYLELAIDGLSGKDVEKLMSREILSIRERHKKAVEILRKGGETAPAMGLIGTLIGLVQMLGNLSDPTTIGPAMAIALLTTLYGAVFSYLVLIPLASKLEKNSKEEIEILKIYGEAVFAISMNEGPFRLEAKMNAFLSPEEKLKIY